MIFPTATLLGMRSNTGSVYEASLWLPISSISEPIASAKSCYAAWERAEAVGVRTHFALRPLGALIPFRNNGTRR
jgi:hypothetical protein